MLHLWFPTSKCSWATTLRKPQPVQLVVKASGNCSPRTLGLLNIGNYCATLFDSHLACFCFGVSTVPDTAFPTRQSWVLSYSRCNFPKSLHSKRDPYGVPYFNRGIALNNAYILMKKGCYLVMTLYCSPGMLRSRPFRCFGLPEVQASMANRKRFWQLSLKGPPVRVAGG